MFVLVSDLETSGPRARNLRAAAASLAAHGCAILLVLAAAGPVAHFVERPHALTLIAPPPVARRVLKRLVLAALPPVPRIHRPATLTLSPKPSPIVPIEIPQAPVLEPRPPVAPSPELPRTTVPPPVKTGEFAQVIRSPPKPSLQLSLEGYRFASQENVDSILPRGQLKREPSGFDNTGLVMEAPKRAAVSDGGFSGVAPAPMQPPMHAVATSGFADAATPTPPPRTRTSAEASLTKPMEILSKTRPAYTPEARALGIQGEVLVEVVFEAARSVRVVRLVKGLGHGLDENAVEAAREIQFLPASREGVPSDTTAVVHILFQLAD